jgi:hypothetical protein
MKNNEIINTEYCIALIRYSHLYHIVHIWNLNTSELLESHIVSEMSIHHCHLLRFLHFFVARSTNEKYVIVIVNDFHKIKDDSVAMSKHSSLYQFKLNSNGKRTNKYELKQTNEFVTIFEAEGQIGLLLFKNGEIGIINLLNFDIILKLYDKQININRPIRLRLHSLFHLLPRDRYQFDCAPAIESFFPTSIIEVGYENKIEIFYILGTQINRSMNINMIQ